MAPTPAAGKLGGTPKTPTKLAQRPKQQTPSGLGQKAQGPADAAKEQAENVPSQASKPDVKGFGDLDTSETGEDTSGKISEATGELEERDPDPISEASSTVSGAQKDTDDAASDVEDAADDVADDAADDATEKAGQLGDDAEESDQDESADDKKEDKSGGLMSGAKNIAGKGRGLASKGGGLASKLGQGKAKSAVDDIQDTAGRSTEDVQDTAGDVPDDVQNTADEAAEDAQSTAGENVGDAQQSAGRTVEGAQETAGNTVDDAQEAAGGAAESAKETAPEIPEASVGVVDGLKQTADGIMPDLSILKGLEVDSEGLIHDSEGDAIGHLVEGDAEDLEGYQIGDDGEILDDEGDLVGRTELLPEKYKQLIHQAKQKAEDLPSGGPGLNILEGLTVDAAGNILNDDGDTVGQLIEGNPKELAGKTFNAQGEILDDDGNVIGRAQIIPEAAELYDTAEELGDEAQGAVEDTDDAGDAVGDIQKTGDGAIDDAGDAIDGVEAELPSLEALEGQEINSVGQIVDDDGNVLGELAEGNVADVKGMTVNADGEVIDGDGNVIGKMTLADGAAEKLKDAVQQVDLRILDGLKVNKKGKILDEEGEPIGELVDGDAAECAGKTVNDKGEVLGKDGKVVGRVKVVPGEAADEAMKTLKDRLGEAAEPQMFLPGLDILDGLKVNKKGKLLNEDGEEIGELVDGDLAACAGKKCNEKGEVLDKDGKIIGRVKTLPQEAEEGAEETGEMAEGATDEVDKAGEGTAEDAVEGIPEEVAEAAEDPGDQVGDAVEDATQLPPLSILEGLKVNKSGNLVDAEGHIVGELIEGDAKKLSKAGVACDAEGQFWDTKGHVIGRAKTVAREDPEEEAPFAGLEGLIVNKDGYVQDENGNIVGQVVEGNPKKLAGRAVDEDGDILDNKGSVVGHAERLEEEAPVEEEEEAPVDLSFLQGLLVNKQGNVIGQEGVPIARLIEGNPKEVAGKKLDGEGQIWNDRGKVIGKVELIPESERESKPEGIFGGLQGLRVVADGKVADEDDNIVGQIVEGNAKRLIGLMVDEDGDIIDRYGNVKGHAEPLEDEEEQTPPDLSILENLVLNKQGFVVNNEGIPVGRLVEGNVKELAGRRCDGEGLIHGDTGKVVGRCELIPENERVARPEGPFAGLEGLRVIKDGWVADEDENIVGRITEGDPKKLVGNKVDEDGDIIDKYGNVKGHAEPYSEEEAPEVDLSLLAGCTVNKQGNIVDSSGQIVGRIVDGDLNNLIGKKVDGKGQIWDNAGNVVGHGELVQGANSGPEGPFAGYDEAIVQKDGTVTTPSGDIIGRIIEGDVKKLAGHKVDEDGDINDKNGNTIGKAERWEPEEKERRINPMSGRRVNKEGEVRDENGDVMGRLTAGDLGHCVGLEVDDNGYVVDNDGNKVGEVTLLENILEEEPEEELTEEEMLRRQDAEIADKMANICQQTIERVQPVCKQITEHIDQAERTPKEELDEEQLVNNVKPLIEEGSRILNECNGSLRGLDPDGRIAAQAKGRAGTREATPEEYRLADLLKELTTTVVTTIDNAKKKIQEMPYAKKKLNPLWALMTEPLFQIIAAVGLLLTGVLGLVGKLLSALGLGGLVNGLLGGLGINKLLGGLGLGSITEGLGSKKDKKKGGAGGLPIIGGLLGGGNK